MFGDKTAKYIIVFTAILALANPVFAYTRSPSTSNGSSLGSAPVSLTITITQGDVDQWTSSLTPSGCTPAASFAIMDGSGDNALATSNGSYNGAGNYTFSLS